MAEKASHWLHFASSLIPEISLSAEYNQTRPLTFFTRLAGLAGKSVRAGPPPRLMTPLQPIFLVPALHDRDLFFPFPFLLLIKPLRRDFVLEGVGFCGEGCILPVPACPLTSTLASSETGAHAGRFGSWTAKPPTYFRH